MQSIEKPGKTYFRIYRRKHNRQMAIAVDRQVAVICPGHDSAQVVPLQQGVHLGRSRGDGEVVEPHGLAAPLQQVSRPPAAEVPLRPAAESQDRSVRRRDSSLLRLAA